MLYLCNKLPPEIKEPFLEFRFGVSVSRNIIKSFFLENTTNFSGFPFPEIQQIFPGVDFFIF